MNNSGVSAGVRQSFDTNQRVWCSGRRRWGEVALTPSLYPKSLWRCWKTAALLFTSCPSHQIWVEDRKLVDNWWKGEKPVKTVGRGVFGGALKCCRISRLLLREKTESCSYSHAFTHSVIFYIPNKRIISAGWEGAAGGGFQHVCTLNSGFNASEVCKDF